jgi:hypothetical protein
MNIIYCMKRSLFILILVAAVRLVCGIGSTIYAEDGRVAFTGRIVKAEGDVMVRRAGEKEWFKAEHGMELSVEDQIMTGVESTADIIFKRNGQRSTVRILEEADMSLMKLNLDKVTGDSEILLDLAIGHIIIKTDPLKGKSRFEVLTPTSMTAVRGTVFEVNVTREESPSGNADTVR